VINSAKCKAFLAVVIIVLYKILPFDSTSGECTGFDAKSNG